MAPDRTITGRNSVFIYELSFKTTLDWAVAAQNSLIYNRIAPAPVRGRIRDNGPG